MSEKDVIRIFNSLPDDKKIKFTQDQLEALKKIMANPQSKAKLIRQLFAMFTATEQQKISKKQVNMLKQILVSFLFSIKPEFMYDWAEIIDVTVGFPLPKNFKARRKYVKSLKWFHIGLKPSLWIATAKKMDELGSVENFFIESLKALKKRKRKT